MIGGKYNKFKSFVFIFKKFNLIFLSFAGLDMAVFDSRFLKIMLEYNENTQQLWIITIRKP